MNDPSGSDSQSESSVDHLLRSISSVAAPVECRPEQCVILRNEDVEAVLSAQEERRPEVSLSTDIGMSTVTVAFDDSFQTVLLPRGLSLRLSEFPRLKKKRLYRLNEKGLLESFHFYSEKSRKVYKLLPTRDLPSFSISSAPMHQITYSTPLQDTRAKVDLLRPLPENAVGLDTCFGLGYSAYELSKYCTHVLTCEVDENVLELATLNPYSHSTFTSEKITICQGDIAQIVQKFPRHSIDVIVHDPPTPKLSPNLYSAEFYASLLRILRPGGKLFHYTPRPNIRVRGRDFPAEVKKRLTGVGFTVHEFSDAAQGFLVTPGMGGKRTRSRKRR